ncbi:uncharacterized protein M6D78_014877 isoform 3-T5 [Vipera latastei]
MKYDFERNAPHLKGEFEYWRKKRGFSLMMEVTRYQFSRSANNSEERVLAHYSEVVLFLEGEPDIPEELRGAKKGMLYLTQYKIIFQHKDKGSTIIRFPLQLLGDCFLEEEPDSKPQHIQGTLNILKEATNLQEYPTASIYTYAHPAAPQTTRSLNMLPLWPPPYPGPPELPPPYSEVEAESPGRSRETENQETCCHCRGHMVQNPANRLD